ncbi:hypothetical protein Fmac_024499 [Flemingia macrophylla]|uniref:Uncharacterized protein n=1 Tax=Flemingia macrophylla TaxID=520843 RepID=A0ABD1LPJ8_9FABA
MAQYGYASSYRISSTYNVSSDTGEPVSKPFAPFVPKFNNGNDTSEGYVTKKKIVPIASRPCYSDNDESDDEWKQPIHGSPRKVDEFLTKVRPSSGYGDYGSNKQIASPTRHVDEHCGPKITSSWTSSPRIETALAKPTNDIKEAIELLKIEGEKLNGRKPPHENNPRQHIYDGPGNDKRAMDLANETERLKKIVPGRPTSVGLRFNPSNGGKGHVPRRSDDVIDHFEASKKYNGMLGISF